MLLMPDHLHAIISFPPTTTLAKEVASFKRYTSRRQSYTWQRDFFDHRLRSPTELQLKANYIRENPVRAGLVGSENQWPHVWEPPR
jgi:putative transposase